MTLEDLLNTLIKRGWKPFWWKDIKRANNEWWFVCFVHKSKKRPWLSEVSHRELVSKESWLWQFCTENGMVEDKQEIRYKADENNDIDDANYMSEFYYWLLESALKDESELEEFLLQNIKVDET